MTRRLLIALSAVAVLTAACGARAATSPAIPVGVTAPQIMPNGAEQIPDSRGSSTSSQTCNGGDPTASLAPRGPLPAPGHMPAGLMATIYQRGFLRAGVDQNTLLWGYRNSSGQLAGFDIDMVDQVAEAIFGPSWQQQNRIHYVIVPNADRIQAVDSGEVDIVAETMTITCSRQYPVPGQKTDPTACCVDFSTEYYDATQRILVPTGSSIKSVGDLAGKRVCAAQGSTSLVNLTREVPFARQVAVVNETDCLVMLQQGQVDAISTDDTILEGLQAQDPNLRLRGMPLSTEPYGMAISQRHPEFTRFVNAVLAKEKSDGEWTTIWDNNLRRALGTSAPVPPPAKYRN